MKQLGKALKRAGFKETRITQKKRDQYKILHLPSAQYVVEVKHTRNGDKFKDVVVHGRSKAGHIRDRIIEAGSNRFVSFPYALQTQVSSAQLHRACFEFVLVEEGLVKD